MTSENNIEKPPKRTLKKNWRNKPWAPVFLVALRQTGVIGKAAKEAQISRNECYLLRDVDPEFRQAWDDALEDSTDSLEEAMLHRARDGVRQYKFDSNGDPLKHPDTGEPYYEDRYSDTVGIFMLKGRRKEIYGENARVDINIFTSALEKKVSELGLDPSVIVEAAFRQLEYDAPLEVPEEAPDDQEHEAAR